MESKLIDGKQRSWKSNSTDSDSANERLWMMKQDQTLIASVIDAVNKKSYWTSSNLTHKKMIWPHLTIVRHSKCGNSTNKLL